MAKNFFVLAAALTAFAGPSPAARAQDAVASPAGAASQGAAPNPNAFNRLLVRSAGRNLPPGEDGIHDPASPGTPLLQAPRKALDSLPKSGAGNSVDWVKSQASGKIQPLWDMKDPKAKPEALDLDIVREVKGSMPDVVFPHGEHTVLLDCTNCHPPLFEMQKGANKMSMAAIMRGQGCGACHGRVAFPVSECRRCHAKPKARAAAGKAGGK